MLFNSVASLPVFNTINTDGFSKEQIVENLMKENLDSFRYDNNKVQQEASQAEIKVVDNPNNGDISLKENVNKINQDDTPMFNKKKKCC